jgi:hypothetical protein
VTSYDSCSIFGCQGCGARCAFALLTIFGHGDRGRKS